MEKSNAVKNKFKFIAILVLVLAIVAGTIIGVYNYKNRKLPILAKIVDTDGKLIEQSILLNANKNDDGTYSLELPNVVNSFIVEDFYNENDEKVLFDGEESADVSNEVSGNQAAVDGDESTNQIVDDTENNIKFEEAFSNKKVTITLTEEELKSREINLKAKYDKKEIRPYDLADDENKMYGDLFIKTLYNKKYTYEDKLTATGYMLENAELCIEEKELTEDEKELTSEKDVNKKIKISLTETSENEDGEIVTKKYFPSTYGEKITIETTKKENNILFYGTQDVSKDKYIETPKYVLDSSSMEVFISKIENVENEKGEIEQNTTIAEVYNEDAEEKGGAYDENSPTTATFSPNGNSTATGCPSTFVIIQNMEQWHSGGLSTGFKYGWSDSLYNEPTSWTEFSGSIYSSQFVYYNGYQTIYNTWRGTITMDEPGAIGTYYLWLMSAKPYYYNNQQYQQLWRIKSNAFYVNNYIPTVTGNIYNVSANNGYLTGGPSFSVNFTIR